MNIGLLRVSIPALAVAATIASAATVPFVEDFAVGAAQWRNSNGSAVVDWSASGSTDGGSHVFTTLSLAAASDGDTPVVFRAQDEFGSSAGAFEGNWISDGVVQYRAYVKHDAPFPLTFFTRFSGPGNFPGAVAVHFVPVFPDTWTEISVLINAANPQFISFEGSDFNTVFSNIGHVQVGVSVGAGQGGFPFDIKCDLDKVTITDCAPECTSRVCGDDGCGGSCGTCGGPTETCSTAGLCEELEVPTVSQWGMAILAMTFLTGLTLRFGRTREAVGS